jgi:hypothetical protein
MCLGYDRPCNSPMNHEGTTPFNLFSNVHNYSLSIFLKLSMCRF